MATSNFEARLKRIQDAHGDMEMVTEMPVRSAAEGGMPRVMRRRRKKSPLRTHLVTTLTGMMLGGIGAVLLLGLALDISPWGPGTDLHDKVYWPAMGALALAPTLILMAVFKAATRPAFALFSLGYLTGLMVPILL